MSPKAGKKARKGKKGKGAAGAGGDQVARIITIRQRKAILKQARIGFVKKLFIIAAVIVVLFSMVFGVTTNRGEDMAPAIRDGDIVVYFRLGREYNNSDVLVYKKDGKQYIGRVIGTPGTSFDRTDKGLLLINGRVHPMQKRTGLYYDTEARKNIQYPLTVSEGHYFLAGDRRDDAKDSRDFGEISKSEINGKVFTILRKRAI